MKEVEVIKNVLIIGENIYGEKCKNNLENIKFSASIVSSANVVSAKGVVGNFQVDFKVNGNISKINAGAIVIAEDAKRSIYNSIKTNSPDVVLTQSEFLKILNKEGKTKKDTLTVAGKIPASICFLLGEGAQMSKTQTYNCLTSSLVLRKKLGCDVFVLCDDLKIAGKGMEELYRSAREEGVIFLKHVNAPEVEISEKIKIRFEDIHLTEDNKPLSYEISCDVLVVDETLTSGDEIKKISSILNIGLDSKGFLQCENVNLYPILTNRKGIFLIGGCHNPDLLDIEIDKEINIVCKEIYNLLGEGKLKFEEKLKVNPDKCAVCLTCVRSCPHKAIDLVDFSSRAHAYIFNQACYRCGICASLCPGNAIEFSDFDDKNIFNLLEEK